MSREDVLEVRDLHTHFFLRRGVVKAVDGVSFTLRRGEVLGLVGESGCGKSLTALSLMRLLPKTGARTVAGEVLLHGENILAFSPAQMREVRGRRISMILQDPQTQPARRRAGRRRARTRVGAWRFRGLIRSILLTHTDAMSVGAWTLHRHIAASLYASSGNDG